MGSALSGPPPPKLSVLDILSLAYRGEVDALIAQHKHHYKKLQDIKDPGTGNNLLHIAVAGRQLKLVKALLSVPNRSAVPDVASENTGGAILNHMPNNTSEYAIHLAARYHHFDILKLLHDSSVAVNKQAGGENSGSIAARSIINSVDGWLNQPLHIALVPWPHAKPPVANAADSKHKPVASPPSGGSGFSGDAEDAQAGGWLQFGTYPGPGTLGLILRGFTNEKKTAAAAAAASAAPPQSAEIVDKRIDPNQQKEADSAAAAGSGGSGGGGGGGGVGPESITAPADFQFDPRVIEYLVVAVRKCTFPAPAARDAHSAPIVSSGGAAKTNSSYDTLNAKNNRGWSPLLLAAAINSIESVSSILQYGFTGAPLAAGTHNASVLLQTIHKKRGDTPLHFAASAHNLELVKLLTDPTGRYQHSSNVSNRMSLTPLHFAAELVSTPPIISYPPVKAAAAGSGGAATSSGSGAESTSVQLVRWLIEKTKANPNWRSAQFGDTPLHRAVATANLPVVEYLLGGGGGGGGGSGSGPAVLSLYLTNHAGQLPIDIAQAEAKRDGMDRIIAVVTNAMNTSAKSIPKFVPPRPSDASSSGGGGANKLFRLQVCSDLHIEFLNAMKLRFDAVDPPLLRPCAPHLSLCGDIGIANTGLYKEFIHYEAKLFGSGRAEGQNGQTLVLPGK